MHEQRVCKEERSDLPHSVFSPNSDSFGQNRRRFRRDDLMDDLAECLPQLVWVAGSDGHKQYCNRQYLEYVGVQDLEALDREWLRFIHPDYRETAGKHWRAAVESGSLYSFEYPLLRHDGVYRHFVARAHPMRDSSGKVVRWLGTSTDIEDQKNAAEIRRSHEKLTTVAQLANSLSHELNNPLAAVTNVLYLALADPAISPETRELLVVAERELKRVAHVAKRTLGFHRQAVRPREAEIGTIFESVLSLSATRMRTMGLHSHLRVTGGARLYCFAEDLQQVFAILVGNALDAMMAGDSLQIRVREEWNSKDGSDGIRVTVADNGCGIAREQLSRLFEPFHSTKQTGVGLGLWIVSELVQKHGGTIRVRSRCVEKSGTVFRLFFPRDGIGARPSRG
jgi:PAS domain S-box-containing protein